MFSASGDVVLLVNTVNPTVFNPTVVAPAAANEAVEATVVEAKSEVVEKE